MTCVVVNISKYKNTLIFHTYIYIYVCMYFKTSKSLINNINNIKTTSDTPGRT